MRSIFLLLSFGIIFTGCTPQVSDAVPVQPEYDIDVICDNSAGNAFFTCDPMQKEECDNTTTRFDCYFPGNFFHIKCNKSTVQIMGNAYFCTSHDGKTVRIQVK